MEYLTTTLPMRGTRIYEAKEEVHHNDFDEKKFCNTMGLPPGFSVGNVEKPRKGDKKTFYCEMCLVELSSMDTMKSHVL